MWLSFLKCFKLSSWRLWDNRGRWIALSDGSTCLSFFLFQMPMTASKWHYLIHSKVGVTGGHWFWRPCQNGSKSVLIFSRTCILLNNEVFHDMECDDDLSAEGVADAWVLHCSLLESLYSIFPVRTTPRADNERVPLSSPVQDMMKDWWSQNTIIWIHCHSQPYAGNQLGTFLKWEFTHK